MNDNDLTGKVVDAVETTKENAGELLDKAGDYAEDVKEKITEIINKAKNDENFKQNLKNEPTKTIEGLLGVDLPDEKVKEIASNVKDKIDMDKIEDFFSDTTNKIKNLFK